MRDLPSRVKSAGAVAVWAWLLLSLWMGVGSVVAAEGTVEEPLLKQAWREYSFMEFKKARRLFDRVVARPPNREDLCQALVGRAFCLQFGGRGNATVADYREAVAAYERCEQELGGEHRLAPFWRAMRAECHLRIWQMNRNPEHLDAADDLWQGLQRDHHGSLFAQEAMLLQATVGLADFTDERTGGHVREMEDYLTASLGAAERQGDEPPLLAPVMANYLAEVYFWRGQYAESANWYREYCRLGPTSFRERNTVWFRLARIADLHLDDRKLAIEYYTKMWKEAKSDRKVYFCSERVRELMVEER